MAHAFKIVFYINNYYYADACYAHMTISIPYAKCKDTLKASSNKEDMNVKLYKLFSWHGSVLVNLD